MKAEFTSSDESSWTVAIVKFLVVYLLTAICTWLLPNQYHERIILLSPLITGLLFDSLTLTYGLLTCFSGKYSSGFPFVGFIFYFWQVIACRCSFIGGWQDELTTLLKFKLADTVFALGICLLCALPHGVWQLQESRRKRESTGDLKREEDDGSSRALNE